MSVRSGAAAGPGRDGWRGRRTLALVAAAATLAAAPTVVQSRPDARQMSCREVQQLVRQSGSVVITTGQFTYQRFVANASYCDFFERVRQEYIDTEDTDVCPVSFVCERRLELFGR